MTRFFTRAEQKLAPVSSTRGKSQNLSLPLLHKLECQACPLNNHKCITPKMEPVGASDPLVYVLGEAPGEDEDRNGAPGECSHGRFLLSKIPPKFHADLRWNNVVRTKLTGSRAPEQIEIECCRPSIIRDIEAQKPKAILALGGVALKWATGEGSIQAWRGRRMPVRIGNHSCWLYPVMHPEYVQRQKPRDKDRNRENWDEVLNRDVKRLFGEIEHLPDAVVEPPENLHEGVSIFPGGDPAPLFEWLDWFAQQPRIAIDLETTDLRPYRGGKILTAALSSAGHTISFAWEDERAQWPERVLCEITRRVFEALMAAEVIVAHNATFEMEWLFTRHPDLASKTWDCTQSQAYILDERMGALGLEDLCLIHFGLPLKKLAGVNRGNLANERLDKVLLYNGADAKYTDRLADLQWELIRQEGLEDTYRMQARRLPTLTLAQMRGMFVDQEQVRKYQDDYRGQVVHQHDAIQNLPEIETYRQLFGTFNPTSTNDVLKMFRDVMKRNEVEKSYVRKRDNVKVVTGYTTDEDALSKMKDVPMADMILKLRGLDKLLSTYVSPLDINDPYTVVYPDGFVHTNFNPTRTSTGRTCVRGDTLLQTDQGTIQIRDLDPTNRTYTIRTHANRNKRITAKWFKGFERMVRIQLESGAYIECTPRHRLLTPTGWKFASSLLLGDLAYSDTSYCEGCSRFDSAVFVRSDEIGSNIDREGLRRVLLIAGSTEQAVVDSHSPPVLCNRQHQDVVSLEVSRSTTGGVQAELSSFQAWEYQRLSRTMYSSPSDRVEGFTRTRICDRDDRKAFPDFVFPGASEHQNTGTESNRGDASKVQSGVFSKGSRASRGVVPWIPNYDSIGEQILRREGNVLLRSVHDTYAAGSQSAECQQQPSTRHSLSGSSLLLVFKRGRDGTRTRVNRSRCTVPSAMVSSGREVFDRLCVPPVQDGARSRWCPASRGWCRGTRSVQREDSAESGIQCVSSKQLDCSIESERDNHGAFSAVRVVSIQDIGVHAVWDITVEDDHSYCAQGLVHHNSSSDPNMQNYPKRKNVHLRRMFVAPPGHKLIAADYGQIEARLIGCASQDEFLCHALYTGYDIHMEWAKRYLELFPDGCKRLGVKDLKGVRSEIKNMLVFPLFYGAQAPSVSASLKIKEAEGRDLFQEFWERFGGVKKWQERLRAFYEKFGFVETPGGRRRHGPLSFNEICNSPIQGGASDIVVDGMNRLSEIARAEDKPWLQPALNIHDDLTFWVPDEVVEESIERIVIEMLNCSFKWVTVPLSVEVSFGENWADMKPIGTFESHKLAA